MKKEDPYQQISSKIPVKSVTLCFDVADLEKVKHLKDKIMKEHVDNYESNGYIDEHSKNYPPSQIQLLAEK